MSRNKEAIWSKTRERSLNITLSYIFYPLVVSNYLIDKIDPSSYFKLRHYSYCVDDEVGDVLRMKNVIFFKNLSYAKEKSIFFTVCFKE